MKTIFKSLIFTVSCALLCSVGFAQTETPKSKKSEEIIIRKKDAFPGKTIIEIDSNEVTINGKPLADYNGDISVFKRKFMGPEENNFLNVPHGNLQFFSMNNNKAMLGVLTAKTEKGAVIKKIIDSSAAKNAGLEEGDIITKFGTKEITSPEDLRNAVADYKPGDEVNVEFLRDGKNKTMKVVLGKNTSDDATFSMGDLNDLLNRVPPNNFNFKWPENPNHYFQPNKQSKLGLKIEDTKDDAGAKVLEVQKASPAEKAGLKAGDVITEINGEKVDGVSDVRSQMMQAENKNDYKIKVKRDKSEKTFEVKIAKTLRTIDI